MNNAGMRVCVCVDVSFHSSGMNAWECDTGSQGKCTLSCFLFFFLRNCQAIFWRGCPFYSPAAVCLCDLQPVASSAFFISAVLTGARRISRSPPPASPDPLIALAISSWLVCHPCLPFRDVSSVHFVSLGSSSECSFYLLNVSRSSETRTANAFP